MRLICPNCGAQYEVPDEVIPDSGRDVQCSNCGDTWFQYHPDHQPEDAVPEATASDWQEEPPETEPEPDVATEPVTADHRDGDAEPVGQGRHELNPAVAEILRQEAALEKEARRSEHGDGFETQQELGLDTGSRDARVRSEQARARMARLRGEPQAGTDTDDETAIDPTSRRNLLPDIDEINSSLGSQDSSDGSDAATRDPSAVPAAARKGAFRSGFRTAVILAALGLLVYAFAPRLSAAIPGLQAPLSAYVEMVNSGRNAISTTVSDLANSLSDDAAGQ